MAKFNTERFLEIVLYVINKINGKDLGKVKLHKILWFSDLEKYINSGYTITNCRYVRRERGPMSRNLDKALATLVERKDITQYRDDDESQWIFKPINSADISFLSQDDIDILDRQIERIRNMTAREISEETHTSTWEVLENGEEMPVALVAMERMVNNNIEVDWK